LGYSPGSVNIPLEDNYDDILNKACRGLRFADRDLAARTGLDSATIAAVRNGQFNEPVVRKLAPVLALNADALVALRHWRPQPVGEIAGLAHFSTPYSSMLVNNFVVFDPATQLAAVFDTGTDCTAAIALPVRIQQIFITHAHSDHILALDRLQKQTGARAHVSEREPIAGAEPFPDGHTFAIGNLRVETRRTSGHARGGTSYIVAGLTRRLAFVGDALFAGSMGGGLVSYTEALETNRTNLLTLPGDTILCPGHGPLTTVAEEREHNPFFALSEPAGS